MHNILRGSTSINYRSNWKADQRYNAVICLPKSPIMWFIRFHWVSLSCSPTSTPSQVSFNHFLWTTSLLLFFKAKWTFTNFLESHHKIGSSSKTPSRIGCFTSKSNICFTSKSNKCFTSKNNKCFMSVWRDPKCSICLELMLICSHNSNLSTQLKGFVSKTWILRREVGESSKYCLNSIQMVRNQQHTKDGVEAFL
jgi:hypothetical protein